MAFRIHLNTLEKGFMNRWIQPLSLDTHTRYVLVNSLENDDPWFMTEEEFAMECEDDIIDTYILRNQSCWAVLQHMTINARQCSTS